MNIVLAVLSLWLPITPSYGEYPFSSYRPDINLILDTNSVSAVAFNFHRDRTYDPEWKGIPVDFEHESIANKNFSLLATITDLRVRPDGSIHCLFEFTSAGEELWKRGLTGRSPVFTVDRRRAPVSLKSVALTYRPLFKSLRHPVDATSSLRQKR